jgi:hypothetical protein
VGDRRTNELALIVYVARKGEGPATIEFTPAGDDCSVKLATDVVETPVVEPEA